MSIESTYKEKLQASLLSLEEYLACEQGLTTLELEQLCDLQDRILALCSKTTQTLAAKISRPDEAQCAPSVEPMPFLDDLAQRVQLPLSDPEVSERSSAKQSAELAPASFDLKKRVPALDFFRFMRELFHNDEELMLKADQIATTMPSLDEAMQELVLQMQWNAEGEAEMLYQEVLKHYFKERNRS